MASYDISGDAPIKIEASPALDCIAQIEKLKAEGAALAGALLEHLGRREVVAQPAAGRRALGVHAPLGDARREPLGTLTIVSDHQRVVGRLAAWLAHVARASTAALSLSSLHMPVPRRRHRRSYC
mgnify:CR=1 FL=1